MTTIMLEIELSQGRQQIELTEQSITIGRGDAARLRLAETGLSRLHASINREADRLYVLDEGSTNGTFVNGRAVPPSGIELQAGDVIRLGEAVTITVRLAQMTGVPAAIASGNLPSATGVVATTAGYSRPLVAAAVLLVGVMVAAGAYGAHLLKSRLNQPVPSRTDEIAGASPTPSSERVAPILTLQPSPSGVIYAPPPPANQNVKLYRQMSEDEKYEFLRTSAQHISTMMGSRGYVFERDVLTIIKEYVDGYARRVGTGNKNLWGEDPRYIYERAAKDYAPYIIASFRKEDVPIVLGLYIPVIETEYHICLESPVGAKGLFQFMPETARGYGVDPADRCDAGKMAPAAARYMKDRIREFGNDAMSVALCVAGYNRSAVSVKRDLEKVLNAQNKERTFWTLIANKKDLDRPFQNENVKYVPKFFAAAIVGEFPATFGLGINKLSTYDTPVK
ncbi:MAG: FHA domain-containing protein [Acidobacteriota bacterium]